MRVVKLKAKDYKDLEGFYKRNNLVVKEGNWSQVRPGDVYISKKDVARFKKELGKALIGSKKYTTNKKYVQGVVSFEWFNIGPSEALSEAIKPGYAIIDDQNNVERFNNDLNEILNEDA